MGYNSENYRRIREEYRTKYLRAYAEADRRMAEVHAKSAELAGIDKELSHTGAEIALAAIGTGEGYLEKLEAVKAKNLALQSRRAVILAQLGYPADYTLPPYECEKCKDTGFVGTKMCDCMRRDLILAGFKSSGLGVLLDTQSFENFSLSHFRGGEREQMEKNLALAKEYAENFTVKSGNLLLLGATGLGKTHLSTAIAKVVLGKGYDVFYTTAIDMMRDLEADHFRQNTDRINAKPERYTDCDLLILDDLGTEFTNQFTVTCVYNVINDRLNAGLPTIINTNLGAKELQERYTARTCSRLIGEYRVLQFVGTDMRMLRLR